jgi:uncharacterized protein YqgV (UPF0045/DUF77 family)
MRITVELSLYPLTDDFIEPIAEFIRRLRREPGIEVISNQLSTQLRGEFSAVMAAVSACTAAAMAGESTVVLVAKFINADLPIGSPPVVE